MVPQRDTQMPNVFGLILEQLADQERRTSRRMPWRASIRVQPLDEDFQSDGEPFYAITSDLSRLGLGFIFPDAIQHSHLRITVSDDAVSAIVRVIHNTSIGNASPLFLVGTEFLNVCPTFD